MKPVYLLKYGIAATMLLAGNAYAQMDSCNVFLQGNHVEIGISPSGSYGSSVVAPSGYHAHGPAGPSYYHPCSSGATTGTALGFVADPLMTGWSTDTAALSHYMGDYFLPGYPFEGWSIQVGGTQYQAFNTTGTGGYTGTLTGSNIGYTTAVAGVTSTWQGSVDSIEITQVTTIDTGNLYFMVEVNFTNLRLTPVNDIYYFRSVDPDNDETWPGGGFPTVNKIACQGPDTTLVTAYGLTGTWTIMGLGTTDTNARCLIYEGWPLPDTVDLSHVYNQTYSYGTSFPSLYTAGGIDTLDNAIGLVYHIAHLATVDSASDSTYRTTSTAHLHPANSASITYFYAFGQAGIDSAFSAMNKNTPAVNPLAVQSVNGSADVKVYPNPSKGLFNVSGLSAGDKLILYDMMGRVALAQDGSQGVNTISAGSISPGAYILVVNDADGNVKSRIPLQKL
jgi:hypothetical protein